MKIKIDIVAGDGKDQIQEVGRWGTGSQYKSGTKYLSDYGDGQKRKEDKGSQDDANTQEKKSREIVNVGSEYLKHDIQPSNDRNTDRSLHTKGSESHHSKELSPQLKAIMINTEKDKTSYSSIKKIQKIKNLESPYKTHRAVTVSQPNSIPEQTISIKTMVTSKRDDSNNVLRAKSLDQKMAI